MSVNTDLFAVVHVWYNCCLQHDVFPVYIFLRYSSRLMIILRGILPVKNPNNYKSDDKGNTSVTMHIYNI